MATENFFHFSGSLQSAIESNNIVVASSEDFRSAFLILLTLPIKKFKKANKNNIKVSYSCTSNTSQIIKKHNKKITSTNSTAHPSN